MVLGRPKVAVQGKGKGKGKGKDKRVSCVIVALENKLPKVMGGS